MNGTEPQNTSDIRAFAMACRTKMTVPDRRREQADHLGEDHQHAERDRVDVVRRADRQQDRHGQGEHGDGVQRGARAPSTARSTSSRKTVASVVSPRTNSEICCGTRSRAKM